MSIGDARIREPHRHRGRVPNRQTGGRRGYRQIVLDALALDLPAGSALCASADAPTRKIINDDILLHSYDRPEI